MACFTTRGRSDTTTEDEEMAAERERSPRLVPDDSIKADRQERGLFVDSLNMSGVDALQASNDSGSVSALAAAQVEIASLEEELSAIKGELNEVKEEASMANAKVLGAAKRLEQANKATADAEVIIYS